MSEDRDEMRGVGCSETDAERFIAKIEQGLADIAAGRVHSHAEVLAWLEARLPGSTTNEATLTPVTDEASRILDAAMQLPEAERAELAAILMDSVGEGFVTEEIKAAWIAEVKRRMAALERGETELVDFDEMMDRLRAKVRRVRDRRVSTG